MRISTVTTVTALLGALALIAVGCTPSATTHAEAPASPGYTSLSAGEAPMGTETSAPTGIGGGPPATSTMSMIGWDKKLSDLAPEMGEKLTVTCPAGGTLDARVLGSEVYAEDSSVCAAAVHAGKITPESGGKVTLEVISGQARYVGSTRNGVESVPTSAGDKSFVFR
jgi:hypothetical protein